MIRSSDEDEQRIASRSPLSEVRSVRESVLFCRLCAVAAVVLFLILTISLSFKRGPWWDEGLFADVALNFRNSGHLRSSVLAPFSFDDMPAVHRYMYWQLPAYLMGLGAWFSLFPVSIVSMRLFSVAWGCCFAASWYVFVKASTQNSRLGLLVASIVILDSSCISASSNGRMDMMCAALGVAALAAYLSLCDLHRNTAAILAGSLGACSFFCHPMGFVTSAWLLVVLIWRSKNLNFQAFALLLAPYVGGIILCVAYIMRAPLVFVAQARGVSSYRTGGLIVTITNIANDVFLRYAKFYFSPHSGAHKLKIFCVLFGFAGALVLASNRAFRVGALPQLLLALVAVSYLGVAAIDNLKYPYYFIYVTPFLSAAGAVWLYESWSRLALSRWAASTLLFGYLLANSANAAYYIRRNDYRNEFRPVIQFVRAHLGAGELVMGPSELGFSLGFGPPLIDDCTLGFTSGLKPKLFVMYPACRIPGYSMVVYNWTRRQLATRYRLALESGGYEVYVRKPDPLQGF